MRSQTPPHPGRWAVPFDIGSMGGRGEPFGLLGAAYRILIIFIRVHLRPSRGSNPLAGSWVDEYGAGTQLYHPVGG